MLRKRHWFQPQVLKGLLLLACSITILLVWHLSLPRQQMFLVASLLEKTWQDSHRLADGQSKAGKSTPGVYSSEGSSFDPAPCKRSLRFAPVPLPVTGLASVQGSGNTWMRHLLQQMTGIFTGSVYSRDGDAELWQAGWYGEGISNGSVVAIKTHGLPSRHFQRAIVLIRNPFDAVFADFNRRATLSHTGVAPAHAYFEYWGNFSMTYAERWGEFHVAWIKNFTRPLFFVNFDDLLHSMNTSLTQVADFLHHPSLTMDIQCAVGDPRGKAKRGKVAFDKETVFSRELTLWINRQIEVVQDLLKNKFPELSRAVGGWMREEKGAQLKWKPLPGSIS